MNVYFLIICAWYILGLGIVLAEHGKPKTGNHSFFVSLTTVSIMIILTWLAINN